jgi:hypothetical protein
MESRPDLKPPMIEEVEKHRKVGHQIMFLPDEQLEERGRIRPRIKDFGGGKPIAPQLRDERPVAHCSDPPLAGGSSSARIAAKTSSTRTARFAPGGLRIAGWSFTADRSDAQDARMARLTSGSRLGCCTTSKGWR